MLIRKFTRSTFPATWGLALRAHNYAMNLRDRILPALQSEIAQAEAAANNNSPPKWGLA